MEWQLIVGKVRRIKEKFDRSHKCLNTDRPTKDETVEKHINILFESLEEIRVVLNVHYDRLTTSHKSAAENFFTDVRGKLVSLLSRRGLEVKVTTNLHETVIYDQKTINPREPASTSKIRPLPETNELINKDMALTVVEFLGLASKILPEFDGKSENLRSFLDALALLDTVKGTHESVAVELVKTKLKGTARNLISSESTIQAIIGKLQISVKGESTEVLTAKILNVRQNAKSANNFVQEIEDLTKSLANAYIADGLPCTLAEKYSTQVAVRSMVKNASSERVRLIMESGTFSNMNEAVTKFVNSCTDNTSGSNVLFYKSRSGNRGSRGGGNGRGRAGNYNRGRGNPPGRGRYQRNGNNFNRQYRGNNQARCVHDQGNQYSPENTHLGDNDN